ncbi:MAG TPA: type II secretion system F family protein, partial [Marmoricola sp.]|nr:type II secretion system F family protein [Marmoricola sp.]
MLRSHESGVPVRMVLQRLSKDLRDQQVADLEARAKSVEVRAAAPLGLCLLPAFVVLGIVPMVAGLFSAMSILR